MIIVRFTSGLGNQMFQYNFYRFLQERYKDTEVKADLTWFYANNDHHGYELDRVFGLGKPSDHSIIPATTREIIKVTGQIPPLVQGPLAGKIVYLLGPVNRIIREHAKVDKSVNHIDQLGGVISNKYEKSADGTVINPLYDAITNLDTKRDWYFTGFWIEERYYKDRVDKLKGEMIFPEAVDEDNKRLLEEIRGGQSVSLHVRRGDYLSSTYSGMFKSLGREYYEKAIEVVRKKFDKPSFYLFSDDPEYMAEAFDWLENKTIVNINSGDNSYRDMQLMSACKANIVANSTFSQWGAILNENEDSMTIYPSDYLKDEDTEEKTLKGWIRI